MRKFRKPRCPYCGKKLSLPSTWLIKKHGEYICSECGGISDIVLDRSIHVFAFLSVLLGTAFFLVSFINIMNFNVWMLFLVILPFFLFFLISVFLVRLRKPNIMKRKPHYPPERDYSRQGTYNRRQ